MIHNRSLLTVIIVLVLTPSDLHDAKAQTIETNWLGGTGQWADATKWSTMSVPDNTLEASYTAIVNAADADLSIGGETTGDGSITLDTLKFYRGDITLNENSVMNLTRLSVGDDGRADLRVNGPNSNVNAESSHLGYSRGDGYLSVENGGRLAVGSISLGSGTTTYYIPGGFRNDGYGSIVVDGNESSIEITNNIHLGSGGGSGRLEIRNGASVSAGSVSLGSTYNLIPIRNHGFGTLIVTDEGSRISSSSASIGNSRSGGGNVTIGLGAAFDVVNTLSVNSAGHVTLDGGDLTAALIENNGVISGFGGINGGINNRQSIKLDAVGQSLNVAGSVMNSPESSLTYSVADGDDGFAVGTLVADAVLFDGTFVLDPAAGLSTNLNDKLVFATYDMMEGKFDAIEADFGNGITLLLEYRETELVGSLVMFGDANLDEVVNISDFGILKNNFGANGVGLWNQGDFSQDGRIDLADFSLLKTYFGNQNVAPVPEPTSIVLGLLAWVSIVAQLFRLYCGQR